MTADPIPRLSAALEGRYRIERELGEGGMATVYLADDLRHERKVALKVLKPELAAVVGAERFLTEIKTTANLQHPHILPLFDSGEVDGFLFYVMPYVEGESLRARLDREKQLPVDEAVRIASDVAEALQAAHDQGVIHRDIKPANILLSKGRPLVSDFGIALAVGAVGGGRLTETGLSLGTPHYMSPEQATGDLDVAPAADVWALGCVLYEMLVGEPPFTGSTAQATLGKIIASDPPVTSAARRSVPPHVDAVVAMALEKVPADRFRSASHVRDALHDRSFRAVRHAPAPRHRRRAFGALGLLAAGTAGLVLGGFATMRLRSIEPPLPPSFEFEAGTATPREFGTFVEVAPDGRSVVFLAGPVDESQLYVRRFDELEPVPIPGTVGAQSPFFSPDGDWVGFIRGRQIDRVRLAGGAPETVVPNPLVGGAGAGAFWSRDGHIYHSNMTTVSRWPVSGSGPESVAIDGVELPAWLSGLPDLSEALAIDWVEPAQVGVVDFSAGTWHPLGVTGYRPHYVEPGFLVYGLDDGSVMAVRFSPEERRTTGQPRRIAADVEVHNRIAQFSVSRNGVLAYVPDGGDVLELRGLDGSSRPLTPDRRNFNAPRFSPDGRRVVVPVREREFFSLWIYDVEGGVGERISGGERAHGPLWSADGSSLIYGSYGAGLMRRGATQGSSAETLLAGSGQFYPFDWDPRGGAVVFDNWSNEPTMRLNFDAAAVDTVFPTIPPVFSLRYSPSGDLIAFVTTETDRWEVHVRDADDPNRRIQVSREGGVNPVWAPDGRSLYYLRWREDEPRGTLMRASIQRQPILTSSSETVVGEWPGSGGAPEYGFDLDPSGTTFARVQFHPERRVVIVTNWMSGFESDAGR